VPVDGLGDVGGLVAYRVARGELVGLVEAEQVAQPLEGLTIDT